MANLQKYIFLLMILLLVGCRKHQSSKIPLASVNDHYLYQEDLQKILPANLTKTDSSLWVDDFIKKWVRSQLMIETAEENLSPEQKNMNQELKEYRNSLLTYRYKQEIMAQKMDTTISEKEIQGYYAIHKEESILNEDIVKAIYLKVPLEIVNKNRIKELCMDGDSLKLNQLNEYGVQYAKVYDRFNDQWIPASEIFRQIPGKIKNDERFLKRNKFIESSDTDYYYFICIRDFRLKGQDAPIDFEASRIRSILLNKRKVTFLKNLENQVYQEGVAANKFKIYNIQK